MVRIGRAAVVAVVLAGLMAGCASTPERADEVCRDVAGRIGALARIVPRDTATQIVPLLDAQLDIARQGRADLAEITPTDVERPAHDALVARWDGVIGGLEKLRDTWQNPSQGRPRHPGDDTVVVLRLSAAAQGATTAVGELKAAAAPAGAQSCGTIPWRGTK
jgi:hypothetical protein